MPIVSGLISDANRKRGDVGAYFGGATDIISYTFYKFSLVCPSQGM